MVSTGVVFTTFYGADVRRHLSRLLTSTWQHSPSSSDQASLPYHRRPRDVVDLRHRRDVGDAELVNINNNNNNINNNVVKLYNCRRRQYVAVATRHVTSRRNDVMAVPAGLPGRFHSLHFVNEISCSSCEYRLCLVDCFRRLR